MISEVTYLVGDATDPIIIDNKLSVICHCCNSIGAWGAGFVLPLGKKYPKAKDSYKKYIESNKGKNILGTVDYVKVSNDIAVANIIGQPRLYPTKNGEIPLDYNALKNGFIDVIEKFTSHSIPFSVHMPRIGCGLAGGDWNIVENIIKKTFLQHKIEVFVYDYRKDH